MHPVPDLIASVCLVCVCVVSVRKQKMDEQRRAQLDKRKQKAMAAPAVLRQNADQLQRQPSLAASPAASPTGGAPFQRQPSYASSSAASSSPPAYTSHDSDDEHDGVAPMDSLDPHMSSMLAQKRADQSRKHISQAERDMLSHGISPVFDPVKAPMSPGGPSSPGGFGFGAASSTTGTAASSSTPVTSTCSAGLSKLDFSDMRIFLTSPIPKGVIFQCYILRNKKGLKNKLYPTYESYMSGEGERFLMAARKRTKNKTSNYLISMDKNEQEKESPGYIGKVRSNFVGTEFVGYDRGCNPAELGGVEGLAASSASAAAVRQELCAVFYESNILGSKGPRKMTAVIPTVRPDGARAIWKPMSPDAGVAVAYKRNPNGVEFMTLVNKTPKWNDVASAYVLNFNGRVTQASVKNFQLIHLDDPETVLLQFGRIGKDTFTMDMQWPLTPMQAFSIALTSFDYKFACE